MGRMGWIADSKEPRWFVWLLLFRKGGRNDNTNRITKWKMDGQPGKKVMKVAPSCHQQLEVLTEESVVHCIVEVVPSTPTCRIEEEGVVGFGGLKEEEEGKGRRKGWMNHTQ